MYYTISDIQNICETVKKTATTSRNSKKILYYNTPFAFDIETTSFRRKNAEMGEDEKCGIMYEWTLALTADYVIIGRKWSEFEYCLQVINETFNTSTERRVVIWVHNLAFEFSFLENRFEWENVFALDTHKPVYAISKDGIEFRCSYILSGYSLGKLAENLQHYKIKKLQGDLDYSLIRHSGTPITDDEFQYCINDVLIVIYYVMEQLEEYDGNITRLPLTKTGVVRRYCRDACLYTAKSHKKSNYKKYKAYRELMNILTIDVELYHTLNRAFQGGFTHCSNFHSGDIVKNVDSFDFCSSYPAVMISEKFPMSAPEKIKITNKEEFRKNLKLYCCVFDIEFINIQPKTFTEHYISSSRCFKLETPVIDNGRVVSASRLATTITEQDFIIIEKFYSFDSFRIGRFYRFRRQYLPRDFVKSILDLYKNKTELKGVKGKEYELLKNKEMLNSCYGMSVTNPLREQNKFINGEWITEAPDAEKELKKYNSSKNRFLYFAWGVWVTAYARRNLFTGIYTVGADFVYADTDSLKITNGEKHREYIERYNARITEKLRRAMEYHNLPFELTAPLNIKGKTKPLGVWECETEDGKYKMFKSLGAKRYMMLEADNILNLTVSGLNKKGAVPYILDKCNIPYHKTEHGEFMVDDTKNINRVFKLFSEGMYIPPEHTGKNIHTYGDYAIDGVITDYLGNECVYCEMSFVNLEAADYHLSIAYDYANYLKGVKEYYES